MLGSVTHSTSFDFCDICLQIQLFRITQCLDFFAGAGNTESFKERGGNRLCDMVAGFCRYFCRVIFVDACFACMFLHIKYFQLYFIRLLSCKKLICFSVCKNKNPELFISDAGHFFVLQKAV